LVYPPLSLNAKRCRRPGARGVGGGGGGLKSDGRYRSDKINIVHINIALPSMSRNPKRQFNSRFSFSVVNEPFISSAVHFSYISPRLSSFLNHSLWSCNYTIRTTKCSIFTVIFQFNHSVFDMFRTSKCSSSERLEQAVLWYIWHPYKQSVRWQDVLVSSTSCQPPDCLHGSMQEIP